LDTPSTCDTSVLCTQARTQEKHVVIHGKQRIIGLENVTDEEEYNQFDELPFFVDTKRINLLKTIISYSNLLPYIALMAMVN
jgi:hypothetical protein